VKPEPFADYLARRSAAGPWTLDLEVGKPLPGAIVIPALAESSSIPMLLDSLTVDSSLTESGLAVIFVVNNRADASSEEKEDNLATLKLLKAVRATLPFPLGLVDAASPGLELPLKDGGVGLARKLGHDLLLPFLDFSSADPVMISLDADTLVKPGYAGAIMNHFRTAAAGGAVIPFEHLQATGKPESRAIERYELFLRCYVAGLAHAGSPYAFQTVGSAMACRASAYLKCGGMNRRRAGEDFYFLQSLAKTSGVAEVKGTMVFPSPRRSARVPFGTGRAMGMLLDKEPEAIRFYRPECYLLLKAWLELSQAGCKERCSDLCERGTALSGALGSFLKEQKFGSVWQGFLEQHATEERLESAFHGWFDAFRTMKFFHYLAEVGYPRAEPEEILGSFPAAWGEPGLSTSERLKSLREGHIHA
jgi:hypothetical protein